jgi:hypothetical protein
MSILEIKVEPFAVDISFTADDSHPEACRWPTGQCAIGLVPETFASDPGAAQQLEINRQGDRHSLAVDRRRCFRGDRAFRGMNPANDTGGLYR